MKKYLLLIILLLPISVLADTYTITYDANDGSGRTKVVEYSDVDHIVLEGSNTFTPLEDDANDPMDDSSIDRWNLNTDNSDWGYAPWGYYETSSMFSSSNNITLYAKWLGRIDLNRTIDNIYLNFESIINTPENEINIKKYDDYKYMLLFKEKASSNSDYFYNQFHEYHYYKLPDWFIELLTDDLVQTYSVRREIPFNLSGSTMFHGELVRLNGKVYKGYYYIKDGYLIVDLPLDDTVESSIVGATDSANFSLYYKVEWKTKYNNGYEYHSAKLSGSIEIDELKETGVVNVKYIDANTNEEISEAVTTRDYVGEQVTTTSKDIDNYVLVESPEEETVVYEVEEKTVYYKYKQTGKTNSDDKKAIVKGQSEITENPKTGVFRYTIITVLLLVVMLIGYYKIFKHSYFKKY